MGELAYQKLKNHVMTLESGAHLSVRQFASKIKMSYTPVREAFLRLQREGALKQVPNVGFFVETIDLPSMVQAYQVRECIEPFILDKIFPRLAPEHIEKMRTIVEQQREALKNGDAAEYMRRDLDMHMVAFDIYGNKYFQKFYRQVREQNMFCSDRIAINFNSDSINEHIALIDALEAGDLDRAMHLLIAHIEKAKQRMKDGYIHIHD